ncbi:unnamed protein product [Effrenium voratum]|nr:unnamed protein product [Effrenium voratum]
MAHGVHRAFLRVLTVVGLLEGPAVLAAPNEVSLSAVRAVQQDTLEQTSAEVSRLRQALASIQEKEAEEEGALDVLQAREKELSSQLGRAKVQASTVPSFLQEASESHSLRRVKASLAAAQLRARRSQEELRRSSAELKEVRSRIAEVQRQQRQMKQLALQKSKLLAETHEMLTGPADAKTMGLPSVLQVDEGSHSKLAEKLAAANQALTGEKAALAERQQDLQKAQSAVVKVATTLRDAEVAGLKKQNAVLLEKLRLTSRSDKAELQRAEAESKHLAATIAEKELQLESSEQELRRTAAQAASDANMKNEHQRRQQREAEVRSKAVLLQKSEERLKSSEAAVAALERSRSDSQASMELRQLQEELGVKSLRSQDLMMAVLRREHRQKELKQQIEMVSRNISNLQFALEQEGLHPVQDVQRKMNAKTEALQDKTSRAKRRIGVGLLQASQHTAQLRAQFRAKAMEAQEKRRLALLELEDKLRTEAQAEAKELQAQNQSLAKLLNSQERQESQASQASQSKATVQTKLQQVRAEEAQLLEDANQQASDLEAQLQSQQQSLELDVQLKEKSILDLQKQRLQNGERIQSMQHELEEVSSQNRQLEHDLKATKEQRRHMARQAVPCERAFAGQVSAQVQQVQLVAAKLEKAEREEKRRTAGQMEGLQRQLEAEESKIKLERDRQARMREEEGGKELLASELGKAKLQEVRGFLAKEKTLSSIAKVELRKLHEQLRRS